MSHLTDWVIFGVNEWIPLELTFVRNSTYEQKNITVHKTYFVLKYFSDSENDS